MADLWCLSVEALRLDLVKFLSEIFCASFLCSVILVAGLPMALPNFCLNNFYCWEPGTQNTERKHKRSPREISQDPSAEPLPMSTFLRYVLRTFQ